MVTVSAAGMVSGEVIGVWLVSFGVGACRGVLSAVVAAGSWAG